LDPASGLIFAVSPIHASGLRMTGEWAANIIDKRRRASETTALSQPKEYLPCDGDPHER
jgi:hypothetical protein